LAAYEVPSKVEFVEIIPRSALGKVLKKELRNPSRRVTVDMNPT